MCVVGNYPLTPLNLKLGGVLSNLADLSPRFSFQTRLALKSFNTFPEKVISQLQGSRSNLANGCSILPDPTNINLTPAIATPNKNQISFNSFNETSPIPIGIEIK